MTFDGDFDGGNGGGGSHSLAWALPTHSFGASSQEPESLTAPDPKPLSDRGQTPSTDVGEIDPDSPFQSGPHGENGQNPARSRARPSSGNHDQSPCGTVRTSGGVPPEPVLGCTRTLHLSPDERQDAGLTPTPCPRAAVRTRRDSIERGPNTNRLRTELI